MKLTAVFMGILFSLSILVCGNVFGAYTADGDISDWGVDVSQPGLSNLGYFDTYLPTNVTTYITEDNAYTAGDPVQYVGPAYSNGNTVDAEAMYFSYDATNIYIAVVTGLNPFISREDIGDLFIDTGKYQTSTSYAAPVDIGIYNPLEAGNIHANSHVDNKYEYALHYYDLNVENYFDAITGNLVPSIISPELYQLNEFTLDSSYPDDPTDQHEIVGTSVTGEPTALGQELRFGPYYQTQSEMADPWAIHYTNYMAWMNDINAYVADPVNLIKGVSPMVVGGLDFAAGTIGNDHFLYEFQIPMAAIGWDPTKPLWAHWTMECGNDELDLIYTPTIVPEPATVSLLGFGLLGAGAFLRKRKNRV